MFYVYILRSLKDRNFYIGRTNDVQRRLREHNSGQNPSTKSRRPLELLEIIECSTEQESVKLEKEYKKGYKREDLKKKFDN